MAATLESKRLNNAKTNINKTMPKCKVLRNYKKILNAFADFFSKS